MSLMCLFEAYDVSCLTSNRMSISLILLASIGLIVYSWIQLCRDDLEETEEEW
jgi:hypothetical protein